MKLDERVTSDGEIRVCSDCSDLEDDRMVERAEALIRDARALGCIKALEKHDHNVTYLTSPIRTKYIDFLDLKASDAVLEVGSSMGQHTRQIAPRCRSLNALEVVRFQAEFARIWCSEDGLDNVHITAGGASGNLPYEDGSFDLVLSNYVLEWCAGRAEEHPEVFHQKLISEMWRVLRPGGRLFLSTKNRFALKYVTGAEDEHLGIRFGSALPRWVQKRAAASADLGHPTGYLHSWAGLRGHLRKAGFGDLTPLFAFPDARYPAFFGKVEDFSLSDMSPDDEARLGKRDRALASLPRQARLALANSLIFLAKKK